MRRLYSAGGLTEAYLVLHRLDRADIAACVLNEHAQGGLGDIPFMHASPEVWVIEDGDFDRARTIVAEHESAGSPASPRGCRGCGERNPPAFEFCWRCGRLLE